jgi:hypothetical protein
VHCSSKKCGFAVNLNSHEAARPPRPRRAPARRDQYLNERRATSSDPPPQVRAGCGRKDAASPSTEPRLRDWSKSAPSPPTGADRAQFENSTPVASRDELLANRARSKDSEGRWKQRRGTAPARYASRYGARSAEPDAPAEYRRRLWSGNVCALGWPARGLKIGQLTVRVATLLPNPSLERRPREACRPWAAQGSRRLHCPARPKGGPPRGSPQLER